MLCLERGREQRASTEKKTSMRDWPRSHGHQFCGQSLREEESMQMRKKGKKEREN